MAPVSYTHLQYGVAKKSGIPVIFTAVTDPVAAELATEDGTPVGEITGTSDKLPVEAQLKMIREILPDAKTIGIKMCIRDRIRMRPSSRGMLPQIRFSMEVLPEPLLPTTETNWWSFTVREKSSNRHISLTVPAL